MIDGEEYVLVSVKRDREGKPLWYRYEPKHAKTPSARFLFEEPPSERNTRPSTPRGFIAQTTVMVLSMYELGKKFNIFP